MKKNINELEYFIKNPHYDENSMWFHPSPEVRLKVNRQYLEYTLTKLGRK